LGRSFVLIALQQPDNAAKHLWNMQQLLQTLLLQRLLKHLHWQNLRSKMGSLQNPQSNQ
jgi:hypothetical protein